MQMYLCLVVLVLCTHTVVMQTEMTTEMPAEMTTEMPAEMTTEVPAEMTTEGTTEGTTEEMGPEVTGSVTSSGSGDGDFTTDMDATTENGTDATATNVTTNTTTDNTTDTPATDPTTNATTDAPTTATTPTPSTSPPSTSPPSTPTPSTPPLTTIAPPTTPSTSGTTPLPTSSSSGNLGVAVGSVLGVLAAVLVVVALIVFCVYIYYRTGAGKMGVSGVGNRKLLEIALENVGNGTGMTGLVEVNSTLLYAHIEPNQLISVAPSDLQTHVAALHAENGYGAENEYEAVKDLDPPTSITYASQPYNEAKNRYINIMASDHTRVMLSQIPKVPGSDYINANYVDGYNSAREYIASQGPLPHTVDDFWRMIWEQETSVIIMVTNPLESGVVKCEEYWPSKGAMQRRSFYIALEGEQLFPEFMVRKFTVKNTSKDSTGSREIVQFHFTSWPDFGVPQEASAMLKFVRHVRSHVIPTHGPMLVHCSAGVGRTGTFIAIDILLQRMKEVGGVVNVQEVVCRMRAQRSNMVQTTAQYLFIYDSLLHAYIHGNTEVKASHLKDHVTSLATPTSEESGSRLDKEFGHVMSVQLSSDHLFTAATEDGNEEKNRNPNSLPLDHNRVMLEELDDKEDSEYINASFIDGYYSRVEFIVTQHPLTNTKADLWRMLLERSVSCLVVFGPLKDPEDRYWPEAGEKLEFYGGLTVQVDEKEQDEEDAPVGVAVGGAVAEGEAKDEAEKEEGKSEKESKGDMVIRKFTVEMEDVVISVRMFHMVSWKGEGPPEDVSGTMQLIQQSRQLWRETGFNPIAIHTATGVVEEVGGVYCGLCILLRQLEVENAVDVVSTIEKIRQQRPSLLTSKEYYRFLYHVLVEALK